MADAPQTPRTRRTREELRALLIGAGRSILEEEGLSIGAGTLTFKRVFEHVEATTGVRLTNASVIRRVWENQVDYQMDVLVAVASTAESAGEIAATSRALAPLLGQADLSSPTGRMWTLREMARVGGEAGIRARLETRDWSLWVGVWVLALTTDPVDDRRHLREALAAGLDAAADVWEQLLAAICAHLGLRVRAPLTLRHYTAAISAMVEGSALRQGGDPDLALVVRPTSRDGGPQEWTYFGICLEALALRFLEIDPDWVPEPAA